MILNHYNKSMKVIWNHESVEKVSIEGLKVLSIKQKDIAKELGITTNSYNKKENVINPIYREKLTWKT